MIPPTLSSPFAKKLLQFKIVRYFIRNVSRYEFELEELSMFCKGGKDEFQVANKWRKGSGFSPNFEL